jgi:chromosome segregation ATPase
MSDRKSSDIGDIPPIVPTRDEVASRQRSRKAPRGNGGKNATHQSGGAGLLARLFIVVSLVVAAVACAWAWQLQQELDIAESVLTQYEQRISDLEDRLSDTDEGMNQSTAAMAVKVKELYSEVDKLWASAWRRNKAKIEGLEKSRDDQGGQITTLSETSRQYSRQLQSLASDTEKLRAVAADLERLVSVAQSNQQLLERLGDDVNRAGLDLARLQQQMGALEEWQASVDGFRKQVNQSLLRLQQDLSAPPAPPGS